MLQVAGRLWHLVLVRGGLVQHLTALKDYFLLAKGDFYQALLSEVSNKHTPLDVHLYTPATHPCCPSIWACLLSASSYKAALSRLCAIACYGKTATGTRNR